MNLTTRILTFYLSNRPTLSGHCCSLFDLVGNKITDIDKWDKFRTISPTVNVAWSIFVSSIHENWSDMTILFYYTYYIPFLSIKPYIPSFAYLIRPLQYMYVCFRYIRATYWHKRLLTAGSTVQCCGKKVEILKKSQNKGRLSYHLWVEFFSQLSF